MMKRNTGYLWLCCEDFYCAFHSVFEAMRIARADARLIGVREKRAKQKAEEAKMATGKPKK